MRLSFILVVAVAGTGLFQLTKSRIVRKCREVASNYISNAAEQPSSDALVVRSQFGNAVAADLKAVEGHTHGSSAANRSKGTFLIELVSRSLGREPYFFQCSAADQRSGRAGSRMYHWAKDLNVKPSAYDPGTRKLIAMVDVDQYVDMNEFLCFNFEPLLIYTFQPGSVSRVTGEYSFTFDSEDRVTYRVSGGGSYEHLVWNYSGDSVKCVWSLWGFPLNVSVYQLERKQMDEDHQLLLLVPLARYWGLAAIVANLLLDGNCLGRLRVSFGRFLRLYQQTKERLLVSTGIVGGFSRATVRADVDDEISSVARTSKVGISLPMVKKKMGDDVEGAEILYEFHKMNTQSIVPQVTYHLDSGVRSYQWFDENYDDEAKPSMVSFMKPLLDGAFCPDLSKSNDARAVRKRILEQGSETTLTPHLIKLVDEWWGFALGDLAGTLRPVDEEYLFEKQNKPAQKRILNEAEFLDAEKKVKSFNKREAGQSVGDPRIISPISGPDKRDFSLYVYAMKEVTERQEWYAFGKSPVETAEKVADICSDAKWTVNSDFERMDGNWDVVARYFERRGFILGFRPEYHDEINEIMDRLINCKVSTAFGLLYDSGLKKLSGEPWTSGGNTFLNCFIAYGTFRSMKSPCGYYGPQASWEKLGIYAGDDGETADICTKAYVKFARKVGQKLEAEAVKRGEMGVKFLARVYSDQVWFGDANSICDLPRTLSKFHTTVHMPKSVKPEDKLFDKAYSLYLTDKNTPIVGALVSRVVELNPGKEFTNQCGAWKTTFDVDKQYPNDNDDDWMRKVANDALPGYDFDGFNEWIETASMASILEIPAFAARVEIKAKPGRFVVDGDVHGEEEKTKPEKPKEKTIRSLANPNKTLRVQTTRRRIKHT